MRSSTLFLLAWSRQLARESTDAATALYQCFRLVHGLPAALPEVPPEAAGAAARRSVPLLRFPSSLEVELEAVLADRGVKPKEARRLGLELTERLKSLSHTPQRGGFGPESSKPAAARGGRLRGADLLAAREAFEAGELLSMDDRAVNAALGLPPPLRDDERHAPQMHKLAPKYKSEAEVMAYVVARMAPEYAVCRRVVDEAVRLLEAAEAAASLPGGVPEAGVVAAEAGVARWRPREALVYGAGVGAAVVAALEAVARPSLTRIVALEPSPLRQMLGSRVEQAHRARLLQQQEQELDEGQGAVAGLARSPAGDRRARRQQATAGPVVSWVQALPPLTKAAAAQRRRYDLVIAPYQLTVLPTLDERQRLVRELWDRCGDVLVLVEPGTPRGFAAIAEARELVLGREGRKRAQLEAAASGPSGGAHMATGGGAGGAAPDPRVVGKLKGAGAHVVAPCPHDGTCPMLGRKRDWCHFSQPLLLPAFMQQAMALPADKTSGRGRALNVQDERFSYVILRRGRRPGLRVAVSRDDNDAVGVGDAGGARRTAASAPAPVLPPRLPPRAVLSQVLLNRAAGETTPAPASAGALPADRAEGLSRGHTGTGTAAPAVAASQRTVPRRAPLFSSHVPADAATVTPGDAVVDSDSPSAGTLGGPGAGAFAGGAAGLGGGGNGGAAVTRHTAGGATGPPPPPGPATAAFARKYPAYGPGLVGRLIALQDAGVEWAAPAEAEGPEGEGEAAEAAEAASGAGGGVGMAQVRTAATTTVTAADGREGGAGGGGSSARSPGLDAAMAALSMSIFGQAPGLAVVGGALDRAAHLGRDGAGAGAWEEAEAGELAAAGAAGDVGRPAAAGAGARAVGTEARDQPQTWSGASLEVPELGIAEAHDGLQMTREEISEEEYDMAERQLVERIYGAEAARAWLAARSAGPVALLGEVDGDDDGGDVDGDDWHDEQADGLEELATAAGGVHRGGGRRSEAAPEVAEVAAAEAAQGGGWEAGGGEGEEELQQGGRGDLGSAADVGAAQGARAGSRRLAEASSFGWGRLVRSPRLRGGHVILDMCVGPQHHYPDSPPDSALVDAAETTTTAAVAGAEGQQQRDAADPRGWAGAAGAGAGADGGGAAVAWGPEDPTAARPQGRLVQQVVARSARRGWMGAPAYRLARRLSWGDCWPDWYIRSHNTREAAAAPSAPAGAGDSPAGADEPEPRLGGRKSAV